MGSVGSNNGNTSSANVSAEVMERRERSSIANNMGLPQDTLGQLATDNFSNEGLEDAIRRGYITQEQANTISNNTVAKISIPKSQVEVDDLRYRTYNGRPSGNGNWAFNMDGNEVFYNGSYANAKSQAITEAARRGVRRIRLLL